MVDISETILKDKENLKSYLIYGVIKGYNPHKINKELNQGHYIHVKTRGFWILFNYFIYLFSYKKILTFLT